MRLIPERFRDVFVPKAWLGLRGARDICEHCRIQGHPSVRALGRPVFCVYCSDDPHHKGPATVRLEMVW